MKKIFILLCFLFPLFSWGTDYFVANEGSDAALGTSSGAAWSTIAKVNSFSFVAGDHIFFKRGGVWYGTLNVRSGSSGNPIVYSAYGTGANPIITGFSDIGPWQNIGTNLWRSTNAIGTLSTCNMVLVNGSFTAISKWPNGNKVYNTVTSFSTRTSLTSSSISGSINYIGSTIVYRAEHWILDKAPITSQSGSTVSFTPPNSSYSNRSGWGFFIQNSQVVADIQNEWWYDAGLKRLGMYSTSSPINIKASTLENIVNIGSNSFVSFNALVFSGSNSITVNITTGHDIRFDSCGFLYNGVNGFTPSGSAHHITLTYCYSDYTNNDFINGAGSSSWTITNNTFRRTAMIAGMGNSSDGQYIAMYNMGANSLIQYNNVVQTGYNGIDFRGSSNIVSNNLVDTFCNVKDDGAGIYTFTGTTAVVWTQRTVDHNIVLNGGGASAGTNTTNSDAHGIYMDDNSSQVTISNNTMANCGSSGLFLHASHDLIIQNNTLYNNVMTGNYGALLQTYPGVLNLTTPPSNITFTGNKIISRTTSQIVSYQKLTGVTVSSLGTWDNNYYCRPSNENASTFSIVTTGTTVTNLTGWKSFSGKDANSHISPVTITDLSKLRFEYNATNTTANISLSGNNYTDVTGAGFSGTLNLAPYTSAVLIQTAGTGNSLPSVNAGGPINLILPTNSAAMSPSYSDADGSVVGFAWSKISGPSTFVISNAAIANPLISGLTTGVYVFRLIVTDNVGGTNQSDITITVSSPGNTPPSASAGSDISLTQPENFTTLSGSGNDIDGTISSYEWTETSGPISAVISSPTSNITGVSGLTAPGIYIFHLKVTDNNGAIGTDDVKVIVNAQLPGNKFRFKEFRYHGMANGDSLIWKVEGDNAIVRYEVERSGDQVSWTRIGTTIPSQLLYFDPFPSTTVCIKRWLWFCTQKKTVYTITHYYYRLRAIDNSATIFISPILKT